MKKLTLNVTAALTEVFTICLTDDQYTALLTMAADGASDEEITEWVLANCDTDNPIEDYEKETNNTVALVSDSEKSTILFNVTEGDEA